MSNVYGASHHHLYINLTTFVATKPVVGATKESTGVIASVLSSSRRRILVIILSIVAAAIIV